MPDNCKLCHSYAINPHLCGREPGVDLDLCDVCYWRKRADRIAELEAENTRASGIIEALVSDLSGFEMKNGVVTFVCGPAFQRDFDDAANWGNPSADRGRIAVRRDAEGKG